MLKRSLCSVALVLLYAIVSPAQASGPCAGSFPNPISDVCWTCMFPLEIGGVRMNTGQRHNGDSSPPFVCTCPISIPPFFRIGVGMAFWEPARIAEVVRTPMCSPTLNGTVLGNIPGTPAGTHSMGSEGASKAFYHVHYFQYPVLSWVGLGIASSLCFVSEPFDMQYITELDPLWDDDQMAFLLNPEAVLFANPIAQAACAADAATAAAGHYGIDRLYWCAGSQGSLFPLSGSHDSHIGAVDSSLATVHKHVFRMHRTGLGMDTSTTSAMCGNRPQPILRKRQYKQQMIYPVSQSRRAYGFGMPSTVWGVGKEFPYKGEDFSYLVWRKRKCCAL